MRGGLIVLILIAPLALAAQALPFEAHLTRVSDAHATGSLHAGGESAALDLSNASGVPPIRFSSATGWLVEERESAIAPSGVFLASSGEKHANTSISLGRGAIDGFAGRNVALLAADGGSIALDASDASLVATSGPTSFARGGSTSPEPTNFVFTIPAGALEARAATSRATISGDVVLFAYGPEVRAGDQTFWTGARNGSTSAAGHDVVVRYLVLFLHDASIDPGEIANARLLAPNAAWDLTGALDVSHASGWIRYANERHEISDAALHVDGDLHGALAGDGIPLLPGETAGARGSATSVAIDGASVVPSFAARAAPVATKAAIVVAALGLLAILPWAAFYSRIRQEELLLHPNRRRLFELVTSRPGLSLGTLARETALAEGVVRYHVEQLEKRRLVATQLVEGARLVVPMELAHVGWRRPAGAARAKVEACVRGEAGLTQADIAARTGLSARLVSYHLGALEKAGDVRADGSRPARYASTGRITGPGEGPIVIGPVSGH